MKNKIIYNSDFVIDPIRIEISATCNALCTYCPTGANKQHKYMSSEFFEKIINHLLNSGIVKEGDLIGIFNRSEPFTNPHASKIIEIISKNKLKTRIGSNFIKYPKLSEDALRSIEHVSFSLNSLQEEKYKMIYGVDLKKVLKNFDNFLVDIKKYNPSCKVVVHWISYSNNKDEEEDARKYFENKGVIFHKILATMLDYGRIFKLLNNPNKEEIDTIEKDFPIRRQLDIMNRIKKSEFERYHCKYFDALSVDIDGEILTCTYIREDNTDYKIGKNIFEIDREWVLNRGMDKEVCKKCLNYMVTDSVFATDSIEQILDYKEQLHYIINNNLNKKFIIYGFGPIGEIILGELKKYNIEIICIYDDKIFERKIGNVDIINGTKLNKSNIDKETVIFIGAVNSNSILNINNKLLSLNIPQNKILNFNMNK